jgi:hypothetical protein
MISDLDIILQVIIPFIAGYLIGKLDNYQPRKPKP